MDGANADSYPSLLSKKAIMPKDGEKTQLFTPPHISLKNEERKKDGFTIGASTKISERGNGPIRKSSRGGRKSLEAKSKQRKKADCKYSKAEPFHLFMSSMAQLQAQIKPMKIER